MTFLAKFFTLPKGRCMISRFALRLRDQTELFLLVGTVIFETLFRRKLPRQ